MASSGMLNNKCRVLILGGCGFIGRHLVTYLVENKLAGVIRVVDKVPPAMAWLNARHEKAYEDPSVEFFSANLLNSGSRDSAFSGHDAPWDVVINLAAETKQNQSPEVYRQGITELSLGCAQTASKLGVKLYVELSDGHLTTDTKAPIKETDLVESYTQFGKCKLQVEELLRSVEGLNYVIVRPGIVYGLGDRNGITPWLILGAIYQHLHETMHLLWDAKVRNNTVHVLDLCRAIWHLCNHAQVNSGQVYHIVDTSDTTLGSLAELVSKMFGVKHSFVGKIISSLAKSDLDGVAEEANDKHLTPWAQLCRHKGVANTPLSPYVTADNLVGRHLWLDNTKLLQTDFHFEYPQPTEVLLREVLDDYVTTGLFPAPQ